jgi:hypothetical protein
VSDVVIELVGGPRDGERITVPLAGDIPAPQLEMTTVDNTGSGLPEIWRLLYLRDEVPSDEGRLWRYRFQSTRQG